MHMGLCLVPQIRQELVMKPPKPEYPKRYDKGFPDKFDAGARVIPSTEFGYVKAKEFWKARTGNKHERSNNISAYEKLHMAEIALRCRDRVGLVLGSTARKLHDTPAEEISGVTSSDLDVLVLGPHGRDNPRPFEWGIDWFVRPYNYYPTNSMVEMVYDLDLNGHFKFKVNPEISHQSRQRNIFLRDNFCCQSRVHQTVGETAEKILGQGFVAPGLYLPDRRTLDMIADYCNSLAGSGHVKKDSYDYLRPQTDSAKSPGYDIPVLPHETLLMKKRVGMQ
jgi:hypothetical protein